VKGGESCNGRRGGEERGANMGEDGEDIVTMGGMMQRRRRWKRKKERTKKRRGWTLPHTPVVST